MVEQFIASFTGTPMEFILDFDATDDAAHGQQEGWFFVGVAVAAGVDAETDYLPGAALRVMPYHGRQPFTAATEPSLSSTRHPFSVQ